MHEENAPYEPDDDEPSYRPAADAISEGVGCPGFLSRYVVNECIKRFPESTIATLPERFDRFYWEPERLLIDLLDDATPETLEEQKARKRVSFKTEWCAANGYLYLALPVSETQDPLRVRKLIQAAHAPEATVVGAAPTTKAPAARRGGMQRPKATA